jgi:hypothetical protein
MSTAHHGVASLGVAVSSVSAGENELTRVNSGKILLQPYNLTRKAACG